MKDVADDDLDDDDDVAADDLYEIEVTKLSVGG